MSKRLVKEIATLKRFYLVLKSRYKDMEVSMMGLGRLLFFDF